MIHVVVCHHDHHDSHNSFMAGGPLGRRITSTAPVYHLDTMNLLTDATHDEEESDEYFTEADFDQEVPERNTPTSDSQSHSRPEPLQCAPPTRKQSSLEVPPTVINHEHHHFHDHNTQGYPGEIPEEFHRSAWYKFDPAVLLALISPIGNWLTGGDHVKNLLFLVLLVYYLHQVIEGQSSAHLSI